MNRLESQLGSALNALNSPASHGTLVLLEPSSRLRSLLVASLLEESQRSVLYYALGPDDGDLSIFMTSLGRALADQRPLGGRALLSLDSADDPDPNAWAAALLRDLSDIDSNIILILDEYDRSDDSDEVQAFMTGLAGQLLPDVTILINGRTIPRLPWVALVSKRRALVLSTDNDEARLPAGARIEKPQTPIDVYALGPGFVLMDNTTIDNWEGHLPRLLLFFALERPAITRSEICAAFWPELDVDQAVNVFHVTKRRLHKALGLDALVHKDGFYKLNPEIEIRSDLLEFADHLISARRAAPDERPPHLQRAVDTYGGPYLQGHDDPWILERRVDYLDGYVEALSGLARGQVEANRQEQALTLLLRALAADPTRATVQTQTLRLYIDMGRRYEAAAHYQALQDRFKKERRAIWPEVEELYREIAQ
ncbi:MAG TPA: BTAD domain-containing putative transcriptional regulator [Candidatus Limnocylindrales bacterium]|nr:BTAD domain-containing putative transcriptional regulator [Candidatus Limnocylindrales bacterium]